MIDFDKYEGIIKKALLIRYAEEKILSLFSEGKINGTVHTCVGQELTGICVSEFLLHDDFILSNHRGHGHYIARTGDVKGLIAEIMGKVTGVCSGFGGSQHIYNSNFISNGIQGGMVPIAAGIALANKYKNLNNIVAVFIGEGTLGEGVIYETFNICSKWELPVLFVLENNGYSQSTSIKQSLSGTIEKRAEGFGMLYAKTNTWNIDHLLESCETSINIVRDNKTPCLLEIETYRLNSHSKSDDNRDINEVEEYKEKDIISQLIKSNQRSVNKAISAVKKIIDSAVQDAMQSDTLQNIKKHTLSSKTVEYINIDHSGDRINEIIYQTFKNKFQEDDRYIMIGEDIENVTSFTFKPYGGAFKVTKDLSNIFAGRIKNTPISEAAITGIGTGLAINGIRPIVEIMFGDFLTLIFDQIYNHACKFSLMFNDKLQVPLIIRTPMGGKRGYGPTHSQSIEKFFLGIPNLNIVALNHRISPELLYGSVFKNNNPTLVIENKILYTRKLNDRGITGFNIQQSDEAFPTLRITPDGRIPKITLVCYGGVLEDTEKAIELAFDEEEILCEIICPTQIQPMNIQPIIDSIVITNRLLIVEEGTNLSALGSEISALIMEKGIRLEEFKRMGNNLIIPSSFEAENNILPNTISIFNKIKEFSV